jgi:hypothetical protein
VCACGTEPSRADGNALASDDTIDGSSPSQDAVEDTAGQGGADTADVEISPDLSDGDGDGDVDDSDGDVTDDSEDDVTEESDDGINDEPDVETPGDGATDESDDTNGDGATDALPPVDADADDIGPDTSDVVSDLPCPSQEGFLDNDGDGFGGVGARGCPDDDGFVTQGGDCNDDDDNVYPGHFRGKLDIRTVSKCAVRVRAHPAMAERDHHIDLLGGGKSNIGRFTGSDVADDALNKSAKVSGRAVVDVENDGWVSVVADGHSFAEIIGSWHRFRGY